MDLIVYALLKSKLSEATSEISSRMNILEEDINNKMAVLDAGLTPVASKNGDVTKDAMTAEAWERLNDESVDIFASVDGVFIKATYEKNQDDEIVISAGNNILCTISEEGNRFTVDWNSYFTDADVNVVEKGILGVELNLVNGEGAGSLKQVGNNTASGNNSFAEGGSTTANGNSSHAEGAGTIANRRSQHVFGEWNITDDTGANGGAKGTYVEIVGNGTINARSNARALSWNGNEYLAGDVYVNCDASSANGVKLVSETDYVTSNTAGIVTVNGNFGINVLQGTNGQLAIEAATSENIKGGTQLRKPIVSARQHESAFYGLAKAAGDTTQSQSSNAVGTYTDDAKTAIKNMLGVATASDKATYSIVNNAATNIQINGTAATLSDIISKNVGTIEVTQDGSTYIFELVESGTNKVYVCNYANSHAAIIPVANDATSLVPTWYDKYERIYVRYDEGTGAATVLNDSVATVLLNANIPTIVILTFAGDTSEKEYTLQRTEYQPNYGTGIKMVKYSNVDTVNTSNETVVTICYSDSAITSVAYSVASALSQIDTATDNDIGKALSPKTVTNGHVSEWQFKSISGGGGGGGGTSDYSDLDNKPQINSVTLNGNKSLEELGIASVNDLNELDISGLKNALNAKAPAIFDESDEKYSFSNAELSEYTDGYTLICDATGLDSIYRIDADNIIPDFDSISALNGVVTSPGGLTFHIEGTRQSSSEFYPRVNSSTNFTPNRPIAAGDTVRLSCITTGIANPSTSTYPFRISLYFRNLDGTSIEYVLDMPSSSNSQVCTKDIIVQKDNPNLQLMPLVRAGEYNCDLTITVEVVTTEEWQTISVPQSGIIKIPDSDVSNNGITLLPNKSVVKYITDTKTYIDEHVPSDMLVESDLIYLSPEMYGAVGDGNTNDTTAVQNCINDAIIKGVAVRGFRHYKITSPISIKGESLNIYIHNITYTGSDVAVSLTGKYNYLCIDRLHAYGSTGAAFRLCTDSETDSSYNEVHLHNVYGYTNGVEMINLYGTNSLGMRQMYYNNIYTNQLYSRTANCFYFNAVGSQFAENSFHGKHVSNRSGYFLYCDGATNNGSNRFYEFCIESASKNGVYGHCTLINCRTTECIDRKTPSNGEGTLFTFTSLPLGKCINTFVDYESIDVSNAHTVDDRINILKEMYESGQTIALSFSSAFPNAIKNPVIGTAEWLWTYYAITNSERGNYSPKGDIIAYFNHKGFVPSTDWYHKINVSDYYTLETDSIVPTIFDIKTTTTIHLDDSYCPIGINKFKVIQTATEKAVIYDHNNVLVFNGQTLDAGTYIVSCYMTDKTITVQTANGTLVYEGNITRGFYFGDNEAWTVEKLNIVS